MPTDIENEGGCRIMRVEEQIEALPAPDILPAPAISVRLEPAKRWPSLNLRELWDARELVYFLIWRDIKVRYKQTILGARWALIQPLFTMLIFSLFFGRLAKVPSG